MKNNAFLTALTLLAACILLLPAYAAADGVPYTYNPEYNAAYGCMLDPDNRLLTEGIAATLIMKMATRLGPSTAYSEILGTLPQDTKIVVIEQTMGSVPWALVDYEYQGARYRAYTGMKRIQTYYSVPWAGTDYGNGWTQEKTEAYYGPGYAYARHPEDVEAYTQLRVFGLECGFLICDFQRGDLWIRAYIPLDDRVWYDEIPNVYESTGPVGSLCGDTAAA